MSVKTILNAQTDFTGEFPAEYAKDGLWRFNDTEPDPDMMLADSSGQNRRMYINKWSGTTATLRAGYKGNHFRFNINNPSSEKTYLKVTNKRQHKVKTYAKNADSNVFATKVICGTCGKVFSRKTWSCGSIWQCSGRYPEKGVAGCQNRHTYAETIEKLFVFAWNSLVANAGERMTAWARQIESSNPLVAYRAKRMTELVGCGPIETAEFDLVLATLESITIFEEGTFTVRFLDGSEIECKGE